VALPTPELDDRKFQDIVDEAKRLIPRHCPEWTNHNLSDPGVALIELFAWMSEMVLFRMNQVPDRLYSRFLDLVGIQPFAPSVATAPVTFLLSGAVDQVVRIPAGTEVATVGSTDGAVVYTTTDELQISQPRLVTSLTGRDGPDGETYTDVWDELRYDRQSVRCFTSDPITPGDAFYLGFDTPIAGNLLLCHVAASIEGIGVDPDHPPLLWETWTGEGWAPVGVRRDTTGGLNRDGDIELLVPLDGAPLTLGGHRGHWLRARLLTPEGRQPPYQASPQVQSVSVVSLGGTVLGQHCQIVGREVLGRSDGSPDQEYRVATAPVLPRHADEVVEVVVDGVPEVWQEVHDFSASGPTDSHIVWDSATGAIRFGPRVRYPDGSIRQHGAIPPDGGVVQVTGYRHGGGARGNVGAGTLTSMRTAIPYVSRVTNLAPGLGGVDGETVENAKRRGPLSLRTGNRAVTAGDFERLTLESSAEVARARCLPPATPSDPVRILVVPHVRRRADQLTLDDFALSTPLVDQIRGYLDARRLLGATVEVGTPYYQGITVAALVTSLPGRPESMVRQRAIDTLYGYINPLDGGPNSSGWDYDTDINAATIGQLLEGIEGVDRVEEVLLYEYDLRTGSRHGVGRELIRLDGQSLFLSAGHQVVVR
jgi:predicted phage baseplate assembly protein